MNLIDYVERRGHRFIQINSYQSRTMCPLHAERDASFYVYHEDMHWHCYGCGAGGDLIGLIWRLEFGAQMGVWRDVFRRVGELGVSLDDSQPYLPPRPTRRLASSLERKCMTIALEHYGQVLSRSDHALAYLVGRGIKEPLKLNLGFCSGNPRDFMILVDQLKSALGDHWRDAAIGCGLIHEDGAERLQNRIYIADVLAGDVIYQQGRSLDPEARKRYLNPREIRKPLYGMRTLSWPGRAVAIVEGVFDALPLHSCGVPAVALLGNRMSDQIEFTRRVQNRVVVLMTDNDETGDSVAANLIDEFTHAGITATRLSPKPNKDVGEWAGNVHPRWIAALTEATAIHKKLTTSTHIHSRTPSATEVTIA